MASNLSTIDLWRYFRCRVIEKFPWALVPDQPTSYERTCLTRWLVEHPAGVIQEIFKAAIHNWRVLGEVWPKTAAADVPTLHAIFACRGKLLSMTVDQWYIMDQATTRCEECSEILSRSNFTEDWSGRNGLHYMCTACAKIQNMSYPVGATVNQTHTIALSKFESVSISVSLAMSCQNNEESIAFMGKEAEEAAAFVCRKVLTKVDDRIALERTLLCGEDQQSNRVD